MFSLDGKCGPSTGDKICSGKWGDCCNYDGVCGSGSDFCYADNCQSGACEPAPMPEPIVTWTFGTTPDGTCGGSEGYTCGVIYGNCCGKNNRCGGTLMECGTGWYVAIAIYSWHELTNGVQSTQFWGMRCRWRTFSIGHLSGWELWRGERLQVHEVRVWRLLLTYGLLRLR
jgi:hypothetical protein